MAERLTEAGKKEKLERLDYLKNVARPQVIEDIKVARGFGDLSENAEYDAARKRQAEVEGEIAMLENMINTAEIISATEVEFCEAVEGGKYGEAKKYTIVGTTEVDLKKGFISDQSPIGKALLRAKDGEEVEVKLPSGKIKKLKIIKVSRA